jgi:hypothetical protein
MSRHADSSPSSGVVTYVTCEHCGRNRSKAQGVKSREARLGHGERGPERRPGRFPSARSFLAFDLTSAAELLRGKDSNLDYLIQSQASYH